MSIVSRMRSAFRELLGQRQPGGGMYGIYAPSEAGIMVTDETAMQYPAVQACVRVLSEDVAVLPLHVYKRLKDGGKERALSHPLYPVLRERPNPEMTAVAFKEALMVNLLIGGNAYAYIEYDNSGNVTGLWPLLYSEVTPVREGGRIVYKIGGKTFLAGEILHIPGLSYDGLVGMSPIEYARQSIGLGVAAERYGETFFSKGTHLGGIIEMPAGVPALTDEQFERTSKRFGDMFKGLQNAHGIPFLEGGATYKPVGVAPEDAQFLETRKFQRSEIAAIYRVPLHMIGDLDRATFSNIEHQDLAYLQRSLLPWLTRIEQGMRNKLLLPDERARFLIEHDTGSYMRGDTKSRMEAYSIAINCGIITPNEARAKENLNPLEGGDEILIPLNMVPGSQASTIPAPEPEPAEPEPEPEPKEPPRRSVRATDDEGPLSWASEEHRTALRAAFKAWLTEEAGIIERITQRVLGERADADEAEALLDALNGYFDEPVPMPEDVKAAVKEAAGPARARLRSQIPKAKDVITPAWEAGFFGRYYSDMGKRLNEANRADMAKCVKKAAGIGLADAVYKRLKAWRTTRPGTMANNEIPMLANEYLFAGYRKCGYQIIWRAGVAECPACQNMNGQTVTTLKPPLHKGCNCWVEPRLE
jgi:HK97 family phage portal protein